MSLPPSSGSTPDSTGDYLRQLAEQWIAAKAKTASPTPLRDFFSDEQQLRDRPELWERLEEYVTIIETFDRALSEPTHTPIIPGYEIIGELDRGGMGVVYQAHQVELIRDVAIKFMHPVFRDPVATARFLAEAPIVAKLRHPNVVSIFDSGEVDGKRYFVMEYLRGGTLEGHWSHQSVVAINDVVDVMIQVAHAVGFAHDEGIIHRDLKPSNILLDESGNPKVSDFGLAKQLGQNPHFTETGALIGTPAYMAPEQAYGQTSALSDIYCLGAILYRGLTQSPPIQGKSNLETIKLLGEVDPKFTGDSKSQVPHDLQTICLKCMRRQPLERYLSADDFAADLKRYRDGRPISAKPVTAAGKLIKWCRRNQAIAVLACLVMLSFAIGLVTTSSFAVKFRNQRDVAVQLQSQTEQQKRRVELEVLRARYARVRDEFATGTIDQAANDLAHIKMEGVDDGWETHYLLEQLKQSEPQESLTDGYWGAVSAATSDDKNLLCICDAGGRVVIWDMQQLRVQHVAACGHYDDELGRGLHYLELNEQQQRNVAASLTWSGHDQGFLLGHQGGEITLASSAGGPPESIYQHSAAVTVIAEISPGLVSFGDVNGDVWLLRAGAEQERPQYKVSARFQANGEITCIHPLSPAHRFVVGTASGMVYRMSVKSSPAADSLQQIDSIALTGPIWCMTEYAPRVGSGRSDAQQLLVGDGSQNVQFLACTEDSLQRLSPLLPHPQTKLLGNVHAISIVDDGQTLIVGDSERRLSRWNLETRQHEWSAANAVRFLQYPDFTPPSGSAAPLGFQKEFAWIGKYGFENRRFVMSTGSDATIKWWQANETLGQLGGQPLQTGVNEAPHIAFDSRNPNWLWTADASGVVTLVDVEQDHQLWHERVADAEMTAIVSIPENPMVVSLSSNGVLREHRYSSPSSLSDGSQLTVEELKRRSFADRPISLAVSPDAQQLAMVTESGWLRVIRVSDLTDVFQAHLQEGNQTGTPLTGCLAYSADGKRLTAAGCGQLIFSFERSGDSVRHRSVIPVGGGYGLLAIVLSPTKANESFQALDYVSPYQVLNCDGVEKSSESSKTWTMRQNQRCQRLVPTPDGRRILALETDGTLQFFHASSYDGLYRLRLSQQASFDLGINSTGSTIIASAKDGQLIQLARKTPSTQRLNNEDVAPLELWQRRDLVPANDTVELSLPTRFALVTEDQRLHVAYAERQASKPESLYQLKVIDWSDHSTNRHDVAEQIDSGRVHSDEMIHLSDGFDKSIGLIHGMWLPDHARRSRLFVTTQDKSQPEQWHTTVVSDYENAGLRPHAVELAGHPHIIHYAFNGYHLRISTRGSDGTWRDQRLTPRGVSYETWDALPINDELHILHNLTRSVREAAKRTFRHAIWKPGEDVATYREPGIGLKFASPFLLEDRDGHLTTIMRHSTARLKKIRPSNFVARRVNGDWKYWMDFPFSYGEFIAGPIITDDNRLLVVTQRQLGMPSKHQPTQLRLHTGTEAGWTSSIIAQFAGHPPERATLVQQNGQPLLIIARSTNPAFIQRLMP